MKQPSTEPEYLVENPLEKKLPSTVQLDLSNHVCMEQVVVDLEQLSKALGMHLGILEKILDSVHVLVRSVQGR